MSQKATVIIATFNMAATLPRALESVAKQTYRGIELIVVDDASTDNTRELVRQFADANQRSDLAITYLRQGTNAKKPKAVNKAIGVATGDTIAILDADDTLTKDSLEKRCRALEENPQWVGVVSAANYLRPNGSLENVKVLEVPIDKLYRGILGSMRMPVYPPSLMARAEKMRAVGGFGEDLHRAEDADMCLRLLKLGPLGYVNEPTYNYFTDTHYIKTRIKNRFKGFVPLMKMIYRHSEGNEWMYLMPKKAMGELLLKPVFELFSASKIPYKK